MISEVTQIILVLLTLFYVIFTFFLVKSSFQSLENSNRPYVNFSIVPSEEKLLKLLIQNTGNRIAEDVLISTNPSLQSSQIDTKYFDDKLSYQSLAPNFSYEALFDLLCKNDTPTTYDVTISYSFNKKNYTEKYKIDFAMFKNYITATPSDEKDNKISSIVNELKIMNENFGNLKRK